MSYKFGSPGPATPPPAAATPATNAVSAADATTCSKSVAFSAWIPKDASTNATATSTTAMTTATATTSSSRIMTAPPQSTAQAGGVEGTVAFPSRVGASYRFELVANDGKRAIWLEDRKSKKQWRTTQLSLSDFVHDDNTIPMATFEDYAKCFRNCLQAASTTHPDFKRDLVAASDVPEAWELQLTLKIRVLTSVWTPTYSFVLKPVPLEPTDLLAAKIRDQEDETTNLQKQVGALIKKRDSKGSKKQPPVVLRGTLVNQQAAGKLVWKVDELFLMGKLGFRATGAIWFAGSGTFVVNAMVQNTNSNNGTALELQVNGKSVVSCVDSNANGHHHVSSIYHVLTVAPEDEIVVYYRGNNSAYAGSYIVIHELH